LSGAGGAIEAKGQQVMATSIPVVIASDQSSVTVDTELPAAAALTDNFANPTAPGVGAFLMEWDGATWDRGPGTSVDGLLVNLGANNDVTVTGTVTVDTELPAAAALTDNFANPTVPGVGAFGMLWDGATWDRMPGNSVDGVLVNLGANNDVTFSETPPTSPVVSAQTSAALAAGSAAALNTAEAASQKLRKVYVWSTVAFKFTVHTVDNGVESAVKGYGGGQAFQMAEYMPPHKDYITLGATAGADNFRVNVTNLDDTNAADVYATIFYES